MRSNTFLGSYWGFHWLWNLLVPSLGKTRTRCLANNPLACLPTVQKVQDWALLHTLCDSTTDFHSINNRRRWTWLQANLYLWLLEGATQLLFDRFDLSIFRLPHWSRLKPSQIVMALVALHRFVSCKVVVVVPGLVIVSDTVKVVHMSSRYDIDLLICQYWSLHCILLDGIFLFIESRCSHLIIHILSHAFCLFYLRGCSIFFIVEGILGFGLVLGAQCVLLEYFSALWVVVGKCISKEIGWFVVFGVFWNNITLLNCHWDLLFLLNLRNLA